MVHIIEKMHMRKMDCHLGNLHTACTIPQPPYFPEPCPEGLLGHPPSQTETTTHEDCLAIWCPNPRTEPAMPDITLVDIAKLSICSAEQFSVGLPDRREMQVTHLLQMSLCAAVLNFPLLLEPIIVCPNVIYFQACIKNLPCASLLQGLQRHTFLKPVQTPWLHRQCLPSYYH